jgi:IPT/TIG domain
MTTMARSLLMAAALALLATQVLAQLLGGPMVPGGGSPMVPFGQSGGGGGTCGTSQPSVTGLAPTGGPTAGGTSVTISGSQFGGLSGAAAVKFGATNATSYSVISCATIVALSPAHVAATIDVTVTNTIGTSPTSSADQFTFSACSNSMDFSQPCNTQYGF